MSCNFRSTFVSGKAAKILIFVALLHLIFFSASTIHAQLDPSFGTNGVSATNISAPPVANFILPDGKIFVVIDYWSEPVKFARFNSDGTPDAAYGNGGVVEPVMPFNNQSNGHIYTALRQADGKIVVAGNDSTQGFIARFNENGTLDTGFATGGVHRTSLGTYYDEFQNIILLPDGKILGVGTSSNSGSDMRYVFLMRYSADGVLDTTFGGGNGYTKYDDLLASPGIVEMKVLRQSDGKLLVYRKLTYEYENTARVRRFNTDGTLDNTYPGIYLHGSFSRWALQADDKLLVAGIVNKTETLERKHKDVSVARYAASGSVDTTFGNGGAASLDITSYFDDEPKALLVLPDGQILVSVQTSVPLNRSAYRGYKIALARLSANGNTVTGKFLQTDASVPIDSYSILNGSSLLTRLPDGKILTIHHWWNNGNSRLLLTRALDVPIVTYKFHGTPFDFAYTAVGPWYNPYSVKATSEPTLFRPGNQKWYSHNVPNAFPTFGLSGDIPVPSDYIGNFESELALFRPSNGTWYIAKSQYNPAPATNFIAVQWGLSGDVPVPADYDGDGKSDIAVFRPSDGVWYIRRSSDNSAYILQWGLTGDKPAVGDFDGDGLSDVAVWRPSDGVWYVYRSSDAQAYIVKFGLNGDIPVQEDFDGDGKTDIAVFRPSSGDWYVWKSSDGGYIFFHWGLSGDVPTPADYDGDSKIDFAVWRPSTGRWYINRSSDNVLTEIVWGTPTDIPVQGKN